MKLEGFPSTGTPLAPYFEGGHEEHEVRNLNHPNPSCPSYCYRKTNTNMFVIACGFNIPGVEDSRIGKFLSPRRKYAKFRKEKIGLLRTVFTILFFDLCELSAFAIDIPSFDCGCSPTGNLFSPARSGEKRVLLCLKIYTAWANFPGTGILEHGIDSRKGAKLAKFGGKR